MPKMFEQYPDMGPEEVSFAVLEQALPEGWTLGCLEYIKNGQDRFDWVVYLDYEEHGEKLKWKKKYQNRQFQVVLTRAWLDHIGCPIRWNNRKRLWENAFDADED